MSRWRFSLTTGRRRHPVTRPCRNMSEFVASLFLPHTQMEMSPSVATKLERTTEQVQPWSADFTPIVKLKWSATRWNTAIAGSAWMSAGPAPTPSSTAVTAPLVSFGKCAANRYGGRATARHARRPTRERKRDEHAGKVSAWVKAELAGQLRAGYQCFPMTLSNTGLSCSSACSLFIFVLASAASWTLVSSTL